MKRALIKHRLFLLHAHFYESHCRHIGSVLIQVFIAIVGKSQEKGMKGVMGNRLKVTTSFIWNPSKTERLIDTWQRKQKVVT